MYCIHVIHAVFENAACRVARDSNFRPDWPDDWHLESRGGLMVSTQVRQSEGSGFKSRSGQIAYFHGVKTRLSTLGTGDVPRGSDSA